MLGGDSKPSSGKDAAGSSVQGSAASTPAVLQDPGDREVPLEPDAGDPFEPGISDDLRAARLEGRKLQVSNWVGSTVGDSLFKVDRFRKFIPKRGADGRGLIQFWGPRATRTYQAGDEVPDWTIRDSRRLHTVLVGEIRSVGDRPKPKPKLKIKRR